MSVIFNGATCYPVGNAQLSIVSGKLKVSNIGNTGLDGVTIMVPEGGNGGNNISIQYEDKLYNSQGSLTETLMYKSNEGNIFTAIEKVTKREGDYIFYGYSGFLLPPEKFRLFGDLDGDPVFDDETDNDFNPALPSFLSYIGYGLMALYYGYKLYKEITQAPKITSSEHSIVITYNSQTEEYTYSETYSTDPDPVQLEVIGDQTYTVDTWGIKKSSVIPSSFNVQPQDFAKLKSLTLKAKDFSEFNIESISISPVQITTV